MKKKTFMKKVVYNCSPTDAPALSTEATIWLYNNANIIIKNRISNMISYCAKSNANVSDCLFANKRLAYSIGKRLLLLVSRDHPDLVAVVEALGNNASWEDSYLAVATVTSDEYEIEKISGYECVHERKKHGTQLSIDFDYE